MTYTIEHVYLDYYGRPLEDYTLYTDYSSISTSSNKQLLVLSYEYLNIFQTDKMRKYCDTYFQPSKGDGIYVVPDSKYPAQDIRNNYIMKRKFDEGVCNVFSPIDSKRHYTSHEFTHMMFNEDARIVVAVRRTRPITARLNNAQIFKEMRDNIAPSNYEWEECSGHLKLYFVSANPYYLTLLQHKAKTPCIYYEDLPMSRNELTADQLSMIYATSQDISSEAEKNLIVQLSSLAQSNWKEYPDTMREFLQMIRFRGSFYYLGLKSRSLPKQVREIMEYKFPGIESSFKDDKDRNMMFSFLEGQLNIGQTRYATMSQLNSKLNSNGISQTLFLRFYGTMVKITPKRYEEKDNSVS